VLLVFWHYKNVINWLVVAENYINVTDVPNRIVH